MICKKEGGTDGAQAYRWFTNNFEPRNTIEIAEKTDKQGCNSKPKTVRDFIEENSLSSHIGIISAGEVIA